MACLLLARACMYAAATLAVDASEREGHAAWTRIKHADLDVLRVESVEAREWVFGSRGRVVLEPLGGGIEEPAHGPFGPGSALVAEASAAPIRIRARAGSTFRVMFAAPPGGSEAMRFRMDLPRVLTAGGTTAEAVFEAATTALANAAPLWQPIAPALARARRYIEEHLADDFDLETLSAAVGTGRCHLCRTFSRVIGLPPYRFRAHLRLARARELLLRGQSCSDVAYAVGLCDQSHLSRLFKELTGTTPGAYVRAVAPLAWEQSHPIIRRPQAANSTE